jgi:hypothetical protein
MEKKKVKKIYYVGSDESYWNNLKNEFSLIYKISENQSQDQFVFKSIAPKNEDPFFHQTFLTIIEEIPDIVYIDFTSRYKICANLAKLICRTNKTKNVKAIGLIDQLTNNLFVQATINAGMPITHMKGAEIHDVVWDACTLAFPNETIDPEYARASLLESIKFYVDFRINYVSRDRLYLEGPKAMAVGDKVELKWSIEENILPSRNFKVEKMTAENLYYSEEFAYELSYEYADKMTQRKQNELIKKLNDPFRGKNDVDIDLLEQASVEDEEEVSSALVLVDTDEDTSVLKFAEDDDSGTLENNKAELSAEDSGPYLPPSETLINVIKKRYTSWIKHYPSKGKSKNVKILVIQSSMKCLKKLNEPADQSSYKFIFQNNLVDIINEIRKYRAHIIVFEYESVPTNLDSKIDPLNYNSAESLKEIFKCIHLISGYFPYVVIFNNPTYTSQASRDAFEYAQIMVNPGEIDLPLVFNLAKIFEDNITKKLLALGTKKMQEFLRERFISKSELKAEDFLEKKLFLSSEEDEAYLTLEQKLQLISMTESEVVFVYEGPELQMFRPYRFKIPIPMRVTLVPKKSTSPGLQIKNSYRGLIHAVGEKDKQKLRRFVNSVFSAVKDQQRELEKQELEELKKKYLLENSQE